MNTKSKETIIKGFDETFSAIQTICKDYEERRVIRSKDLFLNEQEKAANEQNDESLFHYYGI